jgi:hypothetical protein
MKILLPLIASLLVLTSVGHADSIQVAADARWAAHVDVDRFLQTQFGEHIAREYLDKQLAKPIAKLKADLGVEVDWRKIHSVTAYGWNFKGKDAADAVLVIRTDLDLPALFDTVMAKLGKNGAADSPLQKIEEQEGTIYQVRNEAFGASARNGVFVVTRTRDRLLGALKIISEQPGKFTSSKLIGPLEHDAFLVLGVANSFEEVAKLPKQAQILQQAERARVAAGEKAENVFVTVSLDARTAEAATQIQQLVQGLIALGNLNGEQNVDLQKLAQGARVDAKEKEVTLAVQLPVQDVISKVSQANTKSPRKAKP